MTAGFPIPAVFFAEFGGNRPKLAENGGFAAIYKVVLGKKRYIDGKKRYIGGKKRYIDGRKRYIDGRKRYIDGRKRYIDGKKRYIGGRNNPIFTADSLDFRVRGNDELG